MRSFDSRAGPAATGRAHAAGNRSRTASSTAPPAASTSAPSASHPPALLLTAFEPFSPQFLRQGDFFLVGAFLVRARRLQGRGEALEAGLGEEGGEAAFAHLALADVGVAIAAGAEGG